MAKRKPLIQEAINKTIDKLKPFEVEPPDKYKTGRAKRHYDGACFKKAYDYFLDVKPEGGILVHGIYGDLRSSHAWVELPGDIIFDGVLQRFYNKSDYYRERQVEKRVEFPTVKLAAMEAIKTGNLGPWFDDIYHVEKV